MRANRYFNHEHQWSVEERSTARRLLQLNLPQPGRLVKASGKQHAAVRSKSDGANEAGVLDWLADGFARGSIPDMSRALVATRRNEPAIGAERHAAHGTGMNQRRRERLTGHRVP